MSRLPNVLIVDDNPKMRRTIRLMIKDLAGEIRECSDGSQALTTFAEQLPDWVFMDIRMKHMDGLTATREIKAAFPDARIIIVTVGKGEDLREAAQVAGACAFVEKDNLLELRRFFNERSSCGTIQSIAGC